jgi:hypothetical protein
LYRAASVRTDAAPVAAFDKVGVAFLQKNCIACHNEKTKRADVSLHHLKTEGDLLKSQTRRKCSARRSHRLDTPPSSKQRPAVADLDAFTASVASVCNLTTVRPSLTPVESLCDVSTVPNTITRSAISLALISTLRPTSPATDIGHGFDNIGDAFDALACAHGTVSGGS